MMRNCLQKRELCLLNHPENEVRAAAAKQRKSLFNQQRNPWTNFLYRNVDQRSFREVFNGHVCLIWKCNPFPHKVKLHQTISLGKTSLKMLFWYLRPRFNMNLQNSKHWKVSAMIVLLRNINKAQRHLAANFPTLKQKSAQLSLLDLQFFQTFCVIKVKVSEANEVFNN